MPDVLHVLGVVRPHLSQGDQLFRGLQLDVLTVRTDRTHQPFMLSLVVDDRSLDWISWILRVNTRILWDLLVLGSRSFRIRRSRGIIRLLFRKRLLRRNGSGRFWFNMLSGCLLYFRRRSRYVIRTRRLSYSRRGIQF